MPQVVCTQLHSVVLLCPEAGLDEWLPERSNRQLLHFVASDLLYAFKTHFGHSRCLVRRYRYRVCNERFGCLTVHSPPMQAADAIFCGPLRNPRRPLRHVAEPDIAGTKTPSAA